MAVGSERATTHPYPKADVAPAGRSIILISYPGRESWKVQGEYHTLSITFTARSRLAARFAPHHPYLSLMIPGTRWSLRHSYYPYYRDPLDGKGEDDILPITLLPTA